MRMDLNVWSSSEIPLPSVLPTFNHWSISGLTYIYQQKNWQIIVTPMACKNPDASIKKILPTVQHRYQISLEPIGANAQAYHFLKTVARTLAISCHGVWVDTIGVIYPANEGGD